MNAGRAPIGTPMRAPGTGHYSHITTIQHASPEAPQGSENQAPQPSVSIPSYQAQTEAYISAIETSLRQRRPEPNSSTSPTTSTTSFAARARAAELAAARAKQMRMAPQGSDIPPLGPVGLNSLTKFKPSSRSRARAWKPLNLDELSDTDRPSSSTSATPTVEATAERTAVPLIKTEVSDMAMVDESSLVAEEQSSMQESVAKESTGTGCLPVEDKGPIPANTTIDFGSLNYSIPAQTRSLPHGLSYSANQGSSSMPNTGQFTPAFGSFGGDIMSNPYGNQARMQTYSYGMENYPAIPQSSYAGNQQHTFLQGMPALRRVGDDPFVGQSAYAPNNGMSMSSSNYGHSSSLSGAGPWEGPMELNYGFPSVQPPPGLDGRPTRAEDSASEPYTPTMVPADRPRLAEPDASSDKRDQLLNTLRSIAESGKSRGNASARTVLYDPLNHQQAPENAIEPLSLAEPGHVAATPQHAPTSVSRSAGPIGPSEALPWKNRPANIHTENMFITDPGYTLLTSSGQNVDDYNPFAAYLKKPVLAHEEHNTGNLERLRRVEDWFRQDNRFSQDIRDRLNLPTREGLTPTQPNQQQVQNASREPLCEAAQPSSFEKGSAFGAIGSGRPAAKPAASSGTPGEEQRPILGGQKQPATDNTEMGQLFKTAFGTLQSYLVEPPEAQAGKFGSFARVPEWCIDKGPNGTKSFYGEDWGVPPQRIGRDPRYRSFAHEARYGLYEDPDRRLGGEGYGRHFR